MKYIYNNKPIHTLTQLTSIQKHPYICNFKENLK